MLKRLLFVVLLALAGIAQGAVYSLPWGPKPQFVDANGAPMSSGSLLTFVGGSSTPQVTFTDSTGGTSNPTTITLNTRGETPNEVWLTGGVTYKFVLKDSSGATVWTVDGVSGVNDVSSSLDEWIAGPAPTYVSATQFTLAGDQTATFTIGRRVRFTVSAGTVYGRITASAFGALTTITVQMDGAQALDNGLSVVSYGILRSNVSSIPERIATAAGTNTYTATVGIARYVIGDEFKVKIANQSTSTTPTLNLDTLGAKTIVRPDGTALLSGQLKGEHKFRYDGTNMVVLNPAIAVNIQVFSGSGTYTPTVGMKFARVTTIGGGGSGGGAAATAGGQGASGGGGGGGGTAIKIVSAATIGASQVVTVGAGGTAAAAGGAGNLGGTSSLGAIVSATGGSGGTAGGAAGAQISLGGLGGNGTAGDVLIGGIPGTAGWSYGVSTISIGGIGGSSIYGGGGLQAFGGNSTGNAGVGFGAGSSGASNGAGQAAVGTFAGNAGAVIVEEFF